MTITENSIKALLKGIEETNASDSDVNSNLNKYNIFQVFGIEYNEVLICRFIGNLLNPHGSHGIGTLPLRFFINDVIGDKNVSEKALSNAVIILEEPIDNDRRVDIVIHLSEKLYPIEVKIWAGDQECRLQDYYRYFFKDDENKKIYYLTPFGWAPSEKSKGDLEDKQIVCLSFAKEISDKWIKKIAPFSSGEVQFVINNFMEVIDKMCANNKEVNDILRVLLPDEDKKYEKSDLIDSAIIMMKHCNEIWSEIRKQYLFSKLDHGDAYELDKCSERDEKVDSHALLRVVKKSTPKEPIALICVDTNLYITAKKDSESPSGEEWQKYQNSDYIWRYITPTPYNGNKFALNKPTALPENKIYIQEILDEIRSPLFDASDMLS